MSWNAIDALDDARDATKSLLWPLDWSVWIRLAIVGFFVGGAGFPSFNWNAGNVNVGPGDVSPPSLPADPDRILTIVLAVVAVAILVGVAFAVVGAVMEFVLVEDLSSRDVRIRAPFDEYLGRGLRLFGFRILFVLVWLLVLGVPFALVLVGSVGLGPGLALLLVPLIFLLVVLGFVTAVVMGLTTDFVVPAMYAEDRGVIDGWRRVWPVLREEWKEVVVYLLVRFGVSLLAGIGVAIVVGLLALVAAIPFVIVGGLAAFAFLSTGAGGLGALGIGTLAVVVLLFGLVVLVIATLVQVPVVTFFRYYSLSLLGYFDESLDLVGVTDSLDETDETDTGAGGTA
jgi:hypothetical protein